MLKNEDVWLNVEALSILFNINRSSIVGHVNNVYKDEELSENSTCAKIAHMDNDGTYSGIDIINILLKLFIIN